MEKVKKEDKCKSCSSIDNLKYYKNRFSGYCISCYKDYRKEIQERQRNTLLEKYGVDNISKIPGVQDKIKRLSIEKYGVASPSQSQSAKDKRKKSCLERYGCEYSTQSDVMKQHTRKTCLEKYGVESIQNYKPFRDSVEQTMLEKYGAKNALENKDILLKMQNTIKEKYDVINISQLQKTKDKVKATNLKNYGVDHPIKNPDYRAKVKDAFFEKHAKTLNEVCYENHVNSIMKKYGVDNISKIDSVKKKKLYIQRDKYWDSFRKILESKCISPLFDKEYYLHNNIFTYKCNNCGSEFTTHKFTPQFIGCTCKIFRSKYEDEIIDWLIEEYPTLEINSNFRLYSKDIPSKPPVSRELDIFIPIIKLGIEFNGLFYHSTLFKSKSFHKDKMNYFNSKEITVIQVFENEWLFNSDIVKSYIRYSIDSLLSLISYNNQDVTIFKELGKKDFEEFSYNNSLYCRQAFDTITSNTKYFGVYDTTTLSLQSVCSISILDSLNDTYLLNNVRFCNSFGLDFLLKNIIEYFTRIPSSKKKLFLKIDLRYFNPSQFLKFTFQLISISDPTYFYYELNSRCSILYEGKKLYAYLNTNNMLDKSFDYNSNEEDSMRAHGYERIYDCGFALLSI
jgi:hypothetical protein